MMHQGAVEWGFDSWTQENLDSVDLPRLFLRGVRPGSRTLALSGSFVQWRDGDRELTRLGRWLVAELGACVGAPTRLFFRSEGVHSELLDHYARTIEATADTDARSRAEGTLYRVIAHDSRDVGMWAEFMFGLPVDYCIEGADLSMCDRDGSLVVLAGAGSLLLRTLDAVIIGAQRQGWAVLSEQSPEELKVVEGPATMSVPGAVTLTVPPDHQAWSIAALEATRPQASPWRIDVQGPGGEPVLSLMVLPAEAPRGLVEAFWLGMECVPGRAEAHDPWSWYAWPASSIESELEQVVRVATKRIPIGTVVVSIFRTAIGKTDPEGRALLSRLIT